MNRVTFTDMKPDRVNFDATTSTAGEPTTTLRGMPIVYNVLSGDRGGYRVRLIPGCVTWAQPTVALYRHDFAKPIGNTANGTLRILPATAEGIPVEIDVPDTASGRDAAEEIEDGYIGGMSFSMAYGFEESYETTEIVEGTEAKIVNVTKCTVDEVSVLIDPAFTATTVSLAEANADEPEEMAKSSPSDDEDEDDEEDDDGEFFAQQKEREAHASKLRAHRLFLFRQSTGANGSKQ